MGKWHNFFLRCVGFSGRVPRLCALKKNANLPYPVKKVCSFFYKCPLEHCTVFSNYLLDFHRAGNMGTSFFTPLWQIECTSLVIATLKENDNFLCATSKLCPQTSRSNIKCKNCTTLWKKFVPFSTSAHLSIVQFFPITCLMFKGLGTWDHLFSHRCGKSNARPWW